MYKEVEFLEFVVKQLVSEEESVSIERIEDELWVLLTLRVAKDDMGTIIGKAWNTVNSLRSILRLLGVKIWKKINLKILD